MKLKWIRYGLEELKIIKSFNDLKILYNQKLPFFISRFSGSPVNNYDVPPSLQIEPTNHCNLDCISCSRDRIKRVKGYMDFDLFKKIINEASEIGVRRIHMYLHGEPMLHPKIIEMIKYVKARDLGITMATNGMLFDRGRIESILQAGVNSGDYFTFSMLGYSKEVHEAVMRKVNHDKVIRNLIAFLETRKSFGMSGPVIETVFYRMPENEHEEKEFIKTWRGIVDHVHPVGEISKQFAKFKTVEGNLPRREKTCKNLWERMTVYWNGDITTCIADLEGNEVFGNLNEVSIKDAWNHHKLLKFKSMHRDGRFQELYLCSNCDWY
jgi:radical SAM protein with 4Fe4S-binding SPASM domain